ncbi:helix-turn-helix domain-containing protein [Halobacteriaceae archaeon GCM10025711]
MFRGAALRADLELDFGTECPVADIDGVLHDIQCHRVGDDCQCDAIVGHVDDGDQRIVHLTGTAGHGCICAFFHGVGCLPHIKEIRERGLLVTTYVSSREQLRELIESVRQVAETVRLVRLVPNDEDADVDEQVLFDLTVLTTKQREALDAAVTQGYYDSPKGISLGDLADDLGISKSALSHRLSAAESKLVTSVLEER